MSEESEKPRTSGRGAVTDATTQLQRLMDAIVDDIMAMSDEEIMAEFLEDGGDLAELEAWSAGMRERIAELMAEKRAVTAKVGT